MTGRAAQQMRADARLCCVARFGDLAPLFEARNMAVRLAERRAGRRTHGASARSERAQTARTVVLRQRLVDDHSSPTCRQARSRSSRAVRSALAQDGRGARRHGRRRRRGPSGAARRPPLVAVSLSRTSAERASCATSASRSSRSTYLAFLDDDNEWQPHHLAVALEALEARRGSRLHGHRTRPPGRHPSRRAVAGRSTVEHLAEEHFVDTNSIVVRRGRGVRFSRLPRSRGRCPGRTGSSSGG